MIFAGSNDDADIIAGKPDFCHRYCSDTRLACACCVRRKESCMCDIEEDITGLQDLRTQLSSAHFELTRMKHFIHALKYSPDADIAWLVVRLRMRKDIAQLASDDPLHQDWYVCYMQIYRPKNMTLKGRCPSYNMFMVLICRYNISTSTLWKLEYHTSTH
jgi:hypothetical protein